MDWKKAIAMKIEKKGRFERQEIELIETNGWCWGWAKRRGIEARAQVST